MQGSSHSPFLVHWNPQGDRKSTKIYQQNKDFFFIYGRQANSAKNDTGYTHFVMFIAINDVLSISHITVPLNLALGCQQGWNGKLEPHYVEDLQIFAEA